MNREMEQLGEHQAIILLFLSGGGGGVCTLELLERYKPVLLRSTDNITPTMFGVSYYYSLSLSLSLSLSQPSLQFLPYLLGYKFIFQLLNPC